MPIYRAGGKPKIPQKMVKHSRASHNRRPLPPQPSIGQGQKAVERPRNVPRVIDAEKSHHNRN